MRPITRNLLTALALLSLAGCQDALDSVADKVEHPLPTRIVQKMKAQDMSPRSPIMMRIFKEEDVLEVWKQQGNGRYGKIAEYEICAWSGELGPKKKEGDRQAPEGFYTVAAHQMNPNSSYYLSFNLGFPNTFDRAHGRTGSNLMVHGACSSAGCYSMTDESVLEIFAFAREAFRGGQEAFQVQAFPFRMTAENMARHRDNEHYAFWEMLKVGYDHFEITRRPPKVAVCDYGYVFNQQTEEAGAGFAATESCPPMSVPGPLQIAYERYQQDYRQAFETAVLEDELDERRAAEAERRLAEAEQRRIIAEARAGERARAAEQALAPIASAAGEALSPLTALLPEALSGGARAGSGRLPPAAAQGAATLPAAQQSAAMAASPVPVPQADPRVPDGQPAAATAPAAPAPQRADRPFWKLWGN